jgi:vitamin B12 transporter
LNGSSKIGLSFVSIIDFFCVFFCRIIFSVALCIFCTFTAFAQKINPDSVYKLPEVKVDETRLNNFSTGLSIIKIDRKQIETNHSLNLAELISENSAVFLKTYGQGSLATIAIRGTGPAHTGLFWNGININPPNLGLSDFALIPAALINSAKIQLGGSASLYGSGVIGGAIHLNSKPVFKKSVDISATGMTGSFGLYEGSASGVFSNAKWYSRVAAYYRECENNFSYSNTAKFGSPEEKLKSADYFSYGATAELHRLFRKSYIVSLHAWHTYTYRNLPPSMTSADNGELQSDSAFRFLLEAKKIFAKSTLKTKVAWLNEHLRYKNETLALHEKVYTQGIISEAEFVTTIFKKATLNIGINYSFYSANVKEYRETEMRNQGAAFLSFLYSFSKINWKVTANLRQELVEGYTVPFTPSLGAEGKAWKFISARANISRSYRVPTMNDRFWQPGGNPYLKPESGWNAEAGIFTSFTDTAKKITPAVSVTAFSSLIDNWILWQPLAGSNNIWSPVNLQKVWSRGVESNAGVSYKNKNIAGGINLFYSYIRSTIVETSSSLGASLDKQLLYVPVHNLNGTIHFRWKTIFFSYTQNYTGKQFTTSDNTASLPGYSTGNIVLNYDLKLNKIGIGFGFRINNIWNSTYQILAYRPMPGRNFSISLTFRFKNND